MFQLTGISLIVVGLIISSENTQYNKVIDQDYASAANVLIFLGCFVFFVSFFGCCGAIKESHCMIFTVSIKLARPYTVKLYISGLQPWFCSFQTTIECDNIQLTKFTQAKQTTQFVILCGKYKSKEIPYKGNKNNIIIPFHFKSIPILV